MKITLPAFIFTHKPKAETMKKAFPFTKRFVLPRFILLGVFIGFLLHISGSCRKDEPGPDFPGNPVVDVSKIHEGAKSLETAFLNGSPQEIKNLLTDDAASLYGDYLSGVSQSDWNRLGEALKTRDLVIYTDVYAEYSYTKDGIQFTFAMACQEDGTWKLMRL